MSFKSCSLAILASIPLLTWSVKPASAAGIVVKHTLGTQHGYLAVRTEGGELIGRGDLIQTARGSRVTTELILHFKDGSIDDEISNYTQSGSLHLLSDHHTQKGPFFAKQLDMTVESNGKVVVHTTDKEGKEKTDTQHIDLPSDESNGMVPALFTNLAPSVSTSVGIVIPALGEGRLVKLAITPSEPQHFTEVGRTETANVFRVHMDLGGIVGAIAPIVGKQPADLFIWVAEGPAPQLVRLIGPLAEDTPSVSIELSGAGFDHAGTATK